MSAGSAAAVAVQEVPKLGTSLLLAVAAIVCPFDCVLLGMIRAGLGVEAICAYLGLSRAILDFNLVRLDLPTPHDRPRRKARRLAWTDEDLRCAIYWRLIGVHPESIGLVVGRSANAVRSKMRRIGVPPPDRRKLHKVDAATLGRTPPDFGFPLPPDERPHGQPAGAQDTGANVFTIVPAGQKDVSQASPTAPKKKASRKGRNAVVPGQRDLTLLSIVPGSKPEVATGSADAEKTPEAPIAACEANGGHEAPNVLGSADLIDHYKVEGNVRLPDTNKAFLTWMTLLYLGGMHYKAIASYLGRTPSSVQATLYRMQIPRDTNRSSFGWTCDLECAVAQIKEWGFELFNCRANPELAEGRRPWFWRRKGDAANRKRRCSRLKNNELDEWSKYKGGHSVEIMTRAKLEAQRGLPKTETGVKQPARLQASMQGFLPIQQGAANEQFTFRGRAPAVRSGLPGNARDQMPWAYPRNGSAARPIARP